MEVNTRLNKEEGEQEGPTNLLKVEPTNSNILYLSKINSLQECPQKFYWKHHEWLQVKDVPRYMTFGTDFHKIAEMYLTKGLPAAVELNQTQDVTADERLLLSDMLSALHVNIESLKPFTTLSTEKSVPLIFNDDGFYKKWYIKTDWTFELKALSIVTPNGQANTPKQIWNVDFKTTSGYGAATQAFYHASAQTLTYQYIAKTHTPNLYGTMILPFTKTKVVKAPIERIPFTKQIKREAECIITDGKKFAEEIEKGIQCGGSLKFGTKCHPYRSGACPYKVLCYPASDSKDYLEEVKANWFTISNPDDHLELKEGDL